MAAVFILRNKHALKTLRDRKLAEVFIPYDKHTVKTLRDYKVAVVFFICNKHTLTTLETAKWPYYKNTHRLQSSCSICPMQQNHTSKALKGCN